MYGGSLLLRHILNMSYTYCNDILKIEYLDLGYMIIGMSGNRYGISDQAKATFQEFLDKHEISMAHHGDCLGADKEFHKIMELNGILVTIHPPEKSALRAYCQSAKIMPVLPYLKRNHNIIDACEIFVAFPSGKTEVLRSGTWSAIRYARRIKRSIYLFYPDGTM